MNTKNDAFEQAVRNIAKEKGIVLSDAEKIAKNLDVYIEELRVLHDDLARQSKESRERLEIATRGEILQHSPHLDEAIFQRVASIVLASKMVRWLASNLLEELRKQNIFHAELNKKVALIQAA